MLIILEGCDGVGKTTLAEQLKAVLRASVIHCTKNTPNNYDFFDAIIEAAKTRNIIADRFMYGQFIYQEEKDRKLTLKELHMLEAKCLSSNVSLIHVRASSNTIVERLLRRNESIINDLTVQGVSKQFTTFFKEQALLPVVEWWTD